MGEGKGLPEILPPEDRNLVQVWRWRVTPKAATIVKGAAALTLLGVAGWLLQNFLQLRGVVNLLASRIDLAFLAVVVFLAGCAMTMGLRHKKGWRIVIGIAVAIAALLVDVVAPKPANVTSAQTAATKEANSRAISESEGTAKTQGQSPTADRLSQPTIPRPSLPSPSNTSPGKSARPPLKQNEVPKSMTEVDKSAAQKSGTALTVSLVGPTDPAIVVDNQTDNVAEGITWELVMFRTTDGAFFSYATQNIGYVKPHSKSARYTMQLNTLPRAPGGGQIANGESFIGTLAVDCPTCLGTTVIVSFAWGSSGWFYQVPDGNGRLLLPKDMSKGTVSQFIELINAAVKSDQRTPIL